MTSREFVQHSPLPPARHLWRERCIGVTRPSDTTTSDVFPLSFGRARRSNSWGAIVKEAGDLLPNPTDSIVPGVTGGKIYPLVPAG